ncbi:MAG: hypothetical protein HFI75_13850 [Lachnospiraceae bacterium]|nr:hypothetical protein [Lachnospiraceae bacterium]
MEQHELWEKEQSELQKHLQNMKYICLDQVEWIAGMDCAYWNADGKNLGVCGYQIFKKETGEVIEQGTVSSEISQQYIPGFLYYREHMLMEMAFNKMQHRPDILCIDGNGILHPRFMGEAVQFGIQNQIATIGISKNLYKFKGLQKSGHLFYYRNMLVGKEILLSSQSQKYAYISAGFKTRLEDAERLVLYMQQFSPPSKYAYLTKGSDHIVREYVRKLPGAIPS